MLPLVAPVLAQVIALNLGARTEARYVTPPILPDTEHVQESTSGVIGLESDWEHTQLTLSYFPSLLLAHLATEPRQALFFQTLSFTAVQNIKRARFYVTEIAGYGRKQPAANALGLLASGPVIDPGMGTGTMGTGTTGTGTTGTGTTGTGTTGLGTTGTGTGTILPANSQLRSVLLQSSTTTAGVSYRASLSETFSADTLYSYSGGADAASRTEFPIFETLRLNLGWSSQFTPTDGLVTLLSTQYGWSADNVTALVETLSETWAHRFDPRTSGRAGLGVSFAHNVLTDGQSQNNVYPTSEVSITHGETLARGTLAFTAGAGFAPAIDPLTGVVDPRLTLLAGIGWARDRFSVNIGGNTSLSLANQNRAGSQRTLGAALQAGYRLGQAVSMDAGVRTIRQTIQGQTSIPQTYAAFVGLNFGGQTRLNGGS